jgi:putative ABC transport system permease protein
MGKIPGLRRLFRLPSSSRTVSRDVADEIAFHLESRASELEAGGLGPGAARRRAEQEFGDVAAARAELSSLGRASVRRSRRAAWLEATGHEVLLAARGLARAPAFTAAVVAMLALGIGVNAAMFGITDRLLLSGPPHVADADGLVRVLYQHTPLWDPVLQVEATMPYADYAAMREQVAAFEEVAAYSHASFSALGHGPDALELRVVGVTPSYFSMLGVRPALGRFFTAEEAVVPRGEPVLVLSHTLWRTRFGSDPLVVGQDVELDNRIFTVIGVAPRGFHGIDLEPVHAWVPMSSTLTATQMADWHTVRWMNWVRIVARLAPSATRELAASQATATYLAAEEYQQRYADDPTAGIVLGSVIAARAPAVGRGTPQRSGRIALWLLGVSGVVLLIACVNVANLMLARGIRRRREVGVRLAMGIGRLRLAGHVLAETLLIALLAGGLGLFLAHWSGQLARAVLMPDSDWAGSPVDRHVLLFAGAAAAASLLIAGLIPALQAARGDVRALLALGGRGGTYHRSRLRSGLVALQATLSVILLVGAGLFVRSLHNVRTVPLGFEPERVALLEWHTAGLDWSTTRLHQVYDASLERVRALPEVEAGGLSMTGPMWSGMGAGIRIPGRDSVSTPPGMAGFSFDAVSPGYFRALGTRVVRGRAFTETDVAGAVPVAMVTESLARWLWPGESAVGQCLVHVAGDDPPCREVVGVVESIRHRNVQDAPTPMFFIPMAQSPQYRMRVLTIQTRNDPEQALGSVRRALHEIEPGLPPVQARLLRHRIEPQLQPWRLGASLFSAFGVLALVLAGLGLYGVVAYDVSQRRRELGVRRAFGARTWNVMALVLGDAYRVIVTGLLVGLAVAAWAAPRLETLLFDVAPRDTAVLGAVAVILLVVGGVAAFVPGLRAVGVEPAEALRDD